jgi:serine/threonine protein kinase
MPTRIGHFEILGELSKSPKGAVYKTNDPENAQTIALKVIDLGAFGEDAVALEQALVAEVESTKTLSSPNIANVIGAGEIEGQFCAAMEYVQGNSVAIMLARHEGFSIWDLLDIGRQLCSALDHAASQKVVHHSLEASKIMCGWDGTVKVLSFGVSSVGNFVGKASDGVPSILYYMSPEQIRGERIDSRSNLYSVGAILYEMVTERKPFEGADAESVRQNILQQTPDAPIEVNPRVHPILSALIMKALAKDPNARFQSGKELLDHLEQCKESKLAGKKPEVVKATAVPTKERVAVQSKFIGAPMTAPRPVAQPSGAAAAPALAKFVSTDATSTRASVFPTVTKAETLASTSAAVIERPKNETAEPPASTVPKFAVDPMMAEGPSTGPGKSFSDICELPPLKEKCAPPLPPNPPAPDAPAVCPSSRKQENKPKAQPGEIARKAMGEIKSVPPRLMLYSLTAAAVLILIIGVVVTIYVHRQSADEDSAAARAATASETNQPQSVPSVAVDGTGPNAAQPDDAKQMVAHAKSRWHAPKKTAPEPAPVVLPGELAVDSAPQGAQVQIDGKSDPNWVTPFSLSNLQPGQHTITVSKAGYSSDSRTIEVAAGSRVTAGIHLSPIMSTLVVKSDPNGASIFVDGKDMGTKTPGQISLDKGQHLVLVRMSGYLDETMTAQFVQGQTLSFSPTLRSLGNADSIKTVGKMSKLFGGRAAQPGQATLNIRTQPKGAEISINQHQLGKNSPTEIILDPGNYIVDITLTGYAPVHKIMNVAKGGKLIVDEVLQKQ